MQSNYWVSAYFLGFIGHIIYSNLFRYNLKKKKKFVMQQLMQYMSPLAGRSDSNLEWQPPPTYEYLQSSLWWILLGKFWGGGVLVRDHRGQAIVALSMKQLFHGDLQGHQIAHINILKRFLLKCAPQSTTHHARVYYNHMFIGSFYWFICWYLCYLINL